MIQLNVILGAAPIYWRLLWKQRLISRPRKAEVYRGYGLPVETQLTLNESDSESLRVGKLKNKLIVSLFYAIFNVVFMHV
jgi:hypothetical protein